MGISLHPAGYYRFSKTLNNEEHQFYSRNQEKVKDFEKKFLSNVDIDYYFFNHGNPKFFTILPTRFDPNGVVRNSKRLQLQFVHNGKVTNKSRSLKSNTLYDAVRELLQILIDNHIPETVSISPLIQIDLANRIYQVLKNEERFIK